MPDTTNRRIKKIARLMSGLGEVTRKRRPASHVTYRVVGDSYARECFPIRVADAAGLHRVSGHSTSEKPRCGFLRRFLRSRLQHIIAWLDNKRM